MDIGICVASHIGDIDYVVRAEALGYSHAWFADSQMLWSDCYATLALAATRTSRIRLGTGVAITGTRPASVNAAGIATINALAPGRTFIGVGAGNTAMRVMGKSRIGSGNLIAICARSDRYCGARRQRTLTANVSCTSCRTRASSTSKTPFRYTSPDLARVHWDSRVNTGTAP